MMKNISVLLLVLLLVSCSFNSKKIEASGTIEIIETNAASKNNDVVDKLFFNEGDNVKKGDLLAEIDHSILDLQLEQTKAVFEKALADYKRINDIFASGNTSLKEKEDAENKYIAAKSSYEITKKQIDNCFIKAPVDGIITNKFVEEGEFLNIGSPVYTISKTNPVNLTVYVSESELGKVKVGNTAKVKIDAYPKKNFAGKVIYISPNAEFTPKNIQTKEERVKQVFAVKIEISNEDGILKPGLPADAIIE